MFFYYSKLVDIHETYRIILDPVQKSLDIDGYSVEIWWISGETLASYSEIELYCIRRKIRRTAAANPADNVGHPADILWTFVKPLKSFRQIKLEGRDFGFGNDWNSASTMFNQNYDENYYAIISLAPSRAAIN